MRKQFLPEHKLTKSRILSTLLNNIKFIVGRRW
jgi:hypothetical protein